MSTRPSKFLGGHGVHVGGAVVDSGKFIWEDNPSKWPEFCAPSPSYHGAVFVDALRPMGNLAYIIHTCARIGCVIRAA